MNRISIELLKLSGKLEDAGFAEHASELSVLAEEIAKGDRLLTVAEAAAWLGCGRRTLDQMISDRRIPAHLIGGRYRFDKMEVLKETKLQG
ncbi:MAG: helix-turn-helix domain-containing protein [Akkermansiaceae bacterium]|nr:helix-turn-helix domain-containing protein [Akkermansiaceae bacterium]